MTEAAFAAKARQRRAVSVRMLLIDGRRSGGSSNKKPCSAEPFVIRQNAAPTERLMR